MLDVVQDLNLERVTTLHIAQYLLNETGTDLCLKKTDTLCKSCYDMHLVILNHIDQQANEPSVKLKSDILI